jgi:hypothetical protein
LTDSKGKNMEFLKANVGTIVVGFIVFAVLALILARLITNFRKSKTACACGCGSCSIHECGQSLDDKWEKVL